MKLLANFVVLILVLVISVSSFPQTPVTLSPTKYTVEDYLHFPDDPIITFDRTHDIGHSSIAQYVGADWYSAYKYVLPSTPNGYAISKITMKAKMTKFEYRDDSFKACIGYMPNSTDLSNKSSILANIGSAYSPLYSFKYDDSTFTKEITADITESQKNDGYMILGVQSYPSSNNSFAEIDITITVEYVLLQITVDNNIVNGISGHGSISIDDTTFNSTPKLILRSVNQNLKLQSLRQYDARSILYDWNTTQPQNLSSWTKLNSNGIRSSKGGINPINFTLSDSDANSKYIANLSILCQITNNMQTEFDGLKPNGYQEIFQSNNYTITAPSTISNLTLPYNFSGWTDSIYASTQRSLIAASTFTYNSLFKSINHSNSSTTFQNSSQRKVVRTSDGYLHMVYESMNYVWYEKSTDDGTTWTIMNNGKPLSTNEAKNPSIDSYNNYQIGIVYQEKDGDNYKIKLDIFNSNSNTPAITPSINVQDFSTGYYAIPPPYSDSANPVIAMGSSTIMVIWNEYDGASYALKYRIANIDLNGTITINWKNDWTYYAPTVPGTNSNSINPTLSVYKDGLSLPSFQFAWEESNKIKYCTLTMQEGYTFQASTPLTISDHPGFTTNTKPSIIAVNGGARLTWVGSRTVGGIGGSSKINGQMNTLSGSIETKAVFMDPSNLNLAWSFGNLVQNSVINLSPQCYSIAWSRSNTSAIQFTDSKTLSTITSLNIMGNNVQLSDGSDSSKMRAISFKNSAAPYSFYNKNLYPSIPLKIESITINSGREGIVKKDSCQFYFAVGDVNVDNKNIEFIPVTDTTRFHSLTDLNSYLVTNPIQVNDNSRFYYSVQYGITDPRAAIKVLGGNSFINFKVEIIDATTNEVLGTSDNVTYDAAHTSQYDNISYQVNTEGIGNRTILLRLKITTNSEIGYSLKNSYATDDVLQKINNKRTIVNTLGAVTNYDLSQNYPNPFNPSTLIKYQIPKAGNVTLKVYDILGKEVADLVNEFQKEGRYNVNFDASKLASGVYIYQIKSNEYTSSKKMMLLK